MIHGNLLVPWHARRTVKHAVNRKWVLEAPPPPPPRPRAFPCALRPAAALPPRKFGRCATHGFACVIDFGSQRHVCCGFDPLEASAVPPGLLLQCMRVVQGYGADNRGGKPTGELTSHHPAPLSLQSNV